MAGFNLLIGQYVKSSSQHAGSDHYRTASETPFKWRFAGGPIVAGFNLLIGQYVKSSSSFSGFL